MTRPTNRQSRSVGNLGDILKHGVLVELAGRLASPTLRYVDTHTFLLHAPPAELPRWNREMDALVVAHPAYARYAALERVSLSRTRHYRCSSGLVLDVLGDRRGTVILGEANPVTRAQLGEQITEERHANVEVAVDALAALTHAIASAGPLLIHVDPFALSPELWAGLAPALDALSLSSPELALVVYRYTRNAPSAWPIAPLGTLGPVAQIRGGPHELAAYASVAVRDTVREVCTSLGWKLIEGSPRSLLASDGFANEDPPSEI